MSRGAITRIACTAALALGLLFVALAASRPADADCAAAHSDEYPVAIGAGAACR